MISGRPGHEDSGVADAWAVLASVADPEIPVLSVVDLGVISRFERRAPDRRRSDLLRLSGDGDDSCRHQVRPDGGRLQQCGRQVGHLAGVDQ